MKVLGYFFGFIVVGCLIIFCVKQICSLIGDIRNRRKSKSSGEVKKGSTTQHDEVSEKEVDSNK